MSLVLLNHLNHLDIQLNNISICQFKFIENLQEWIYQFEQFFKEIFNEKSSEDLNKIKENLINKINLLLNNSNINQDNINYIKQTIEFIKEKLNQIETPIESLIEDFNLSLSTDLTNDLTNDLNNDSNEDEVCSYSFRLSPGKSFYPYLISCKKALNISSDNWSTLSTNDKHLLIISKSKIYLFNENLKILKEKTFSDKGIKDICWSKRLNRFILISPKQIYSLDENQMIICPIKLYFNKNICWERVTCTDKYLFLSTFGENPLIVQFNYFPSIQFYKKYQKEIILNKKQFINDIKSNENYLSIIIEDYLINQSNFQIRSLKSFQCIWIISLGKGWGYRSTFFNSTHWIISDHYNNRFIHILKDGTITKIENYFSKPINIVSWSQQQLIVRTNQNINIHQSQ